MNENRETMMTYHSDTLAFKKSEILGAIQSICPSFHIDCEVLEDKNSIIEKNNTNSDIPATSSDYKKLFYKQDMFDGFEVACLISGYNPNTLTLNKTRNCVWLEENPGYAQALGFVMSASKIGGFFEYDESASSYELCYEITNKNLKEYLKTKNMIIDGFNDDLEIDNANTPKNTDIESQTKIDTLQAELAQAQERIKQLEAQLQQLESTQGKEQIHPSLEPNNQKHAPELLLAIQSWESKYIHNEYTHMEHTPSIKAFLKARGFTGDRLQARIAAITNPKELKKSDN